MWLEQHRGATIAVRRGPGYDVGGYLMLLGGRGRGRGRGRPSPLRAALSGCGSADSVMIFGVWIVQRCLPRSMSR